MSVRTTVGPTPYSGPTLLVSVTGLDRPGISASIFDALQGFDIHVLDVEQAVLRGQLNLAILLGINDPDNERRIEDAVGDTCVHLGMRVVCTPGEGDIAEPRAGRAIVTMLGRPLVPHQVAAITSTIRKNSGNIDRIRRLSDWPVTTVQMNVSGAEVAALKEQLAHVSAEHHVDIAVSAAGLARRGQRLVVMDVDSTLITGEVIEMLARHAGVHDRVHDITERAMRGEIDFADSLRERVALLAGLDAAVLDRVRDEITLTPGARTVCRTLTEMGYSLALVSGGFREVVAPLGESVGARYVRANSLEVVNGTLTGRVGDPIIDSDAKATALRDFARMEGLSLDRTIAIGDGANDVEMLRTAGFGIAFNAKPVVAAHADTAVRVPYLDSVLYLLGISADDVAQATAPSGTPPE